MFDQIYTGTQGAPGKTTLTPAYLSYHAAFLNQEWGQGAAIAFILFVIIVALTIFQRWVLRERARPHRPARPPIREGAGHDRLVAPRSTASADSARSPLYTMLIALAVVYVFPFLVQVATSFKTRCGGRREHRLPSCRRRSRSPPTSACSPAATSRSGSRTPRS